MRKYSKLFFFLVLVFKTKKHALAKPGFIRDLLRDTAPQSACATGVEPLGCLHSWSLQGTVSTLVQNRPCDAGLTLNTLLSSKIKLPCLSATSPIGERGQSHSGNVFNNKNSDQISFCLSTVEYNFKLNKFPCCKHCTELKAYSSLWKLFGCKWIIIPWHAHPLSCWEQSRTWGVESTAGLSQCELLHATKVVPPK